MRLLIVGNGVAGVTTAATAVKANPDVQVEIYSEEPYLYYPRPKLWEFLSGELSLEDIYFYPQNWYDQRGIKLHLGVSVRGCASRRQDHNPVGRRVRPRTTG